ncbi:Fcf2 pre-rRNA processing-domain-containing protein [Coniochaeta sp. 2T2.1]|nr:Fcf2 pre-rRNA processing-domain-containing protein [Coniochaeta sp. 2T2.1]
MATTTMTDVDLSDDQIDRLLAEAESRLAARGPSTSALVQHQSQAVLATTATATPAVPGTAPTTVQDPTKQAKELSVRVPKPVIKEKKVLKDNAGPSWYGLPKTDPATKKDLQIIKLRDVLALGKQHFKKDTRKDPFPEFSQVGTLVEGPTEFYSARLTKKERKRTLVEEVLAQGQALSKFKNKYSEIQERKSSGKKSHYKKVVARRRRQPA